MQEAEIITTFMVFDWRVLLAAGGWGCLWAFLTWAAYRLILHRLLRLSYTWMGIDPAEHLRRTGGLALLIALLIGANGIVLLLPRAPIAVARGFEIALWILVTVLGMRILESLAIDGYLIVHQGMKLPRLLRDIVKFLVYLTIFTTLFHQLYNLNIAPLLTTSAVFTMVIGLALQDTLGNLFAGLAMSIDQPYQREHWITVDGKDRGRVIAITWRSTTIETGGGERVTIPNNVLSKSRILIHQWSPGYHREEFSLRIASVVPSEKVQRILMEAVQDIPYVEKSPAPSVGFGDFGDGYLTYTLGVWIRDGTYPPVRTDVPLRLWYHLARANLAPGTTFFAKPEVPHPVDGWPAEGEAVAEISAILRRVDFLAPLPQEELEQLAGRARLELYASGETLFQQGEEGSTFYLIKRGRVGVMVRDEQGGEMVNVATLEEGAYFGEMSLLTGARRSATTQALTEVEVLAITRENFQRLLKADPAVAESISKVIAKRQLDTQRDLAAWQAVSAEAETAGDKAGIGKEHFTLLQGIRSFFKLS